MVLKPGTMAAGNRICLPEPLEDGDAKSWFRRFDVCVATNDWNAAKKLIQLLTLLRGRAWAIYESLGEDDNASYDALKNAMISRLNSDTGEDHLAACEQLTRRCFQEGGESIDELARDIEKLLDRSSPGQQRKAPTSTNAGYAHGCHHTSLLVLAMTHRHAICNFARDTCSSTEDLAQRTHAV